MYDVSYNEDGTIKEFKPKYEDMPAKVKKRIVVDFDKAEFPESIIVPYTDIVHDRVVLETFRGCTNGCRFCQAGMIYRPVREKTRETLEKQARKLIENDLKRVGLREEYHYVFNDIKKCGNFIYKSRCPNPNHIDNDPRNNLASNLRWVTPRVNTTDALNNELQKYTRWLIQKTQEGTIDKEK